MTDKEIAAASPAEIRQLLDWVEELKNIVEGLEAQRDVLITRLRFFDGEVSQFRRSGACDCPAWKALYVKLYPGEHRK